MSGAGYEGEMGLRSWKVRGSRFQGDRKQSGFEAKV